MFGPSRRELSRQLERERQRNVLRERELVDRIMYMAGRPWGLPEQAEPPEDEGEAYVSALDVLPEEWQGPAGAGAIE